MTITLRVKNTEERDKLHETAEAEGFSTMAAWAMYHLRNQMKQTMAEDQK